MGIGFSCPVCKLVASDSSSFTGTRNQCTVNMTAAARGTAATLMLLILQKNFA